MSSCVRVRMFGLLRKVREESDLPQSAEIEVPAEGITGHELARQLEIPPHMVEGIFINHVVHGLDERVRPGDRVAFVPFGTPGPHRVYLGLYDAGRSSAEESTSPSQPA